MMLMDDKLAAELWANEVRFSCFSDHTDESRLAQPARLLEVPCGKTKKKGKKTKQETRRRGL